MGFFTYYVLFCNKKIYKSADSMFLYEDFIQLYKTLQQFKNIYFSSIYWKKPTTKKKKKSKPTKKKQTKI